MNHDDADGVLRGREHEISRLRAHFDAVASRGADGRFAGPRAVFVVAESGIGKSRLVQELYRALASDPNWNPPESAYWPRSFGDDGIGLAVRPDMRAHESKGPPRFLWVGARWSSAADRNAVSSRALHSVAGDLRVHAEIFDRHRSVWAALSARATDTVRRELGDELRGEVVGKVMEAAVESSFLAGLAYKLARGGASVLGDRLRRLERFEELEERRARTEIDDLHEAFALVLGARDRVPVVLWADDAHWADPEARKFLSSLWEDAVRRKWPLLLLATHWEREWREGARAAGAGPEASWFAEFAGRPGVEVLELGRAADEALRALVAERLPGATAAQASLLVERADGNFLTMVENIGELLAEPMWFEGERRDGALTSSAVEHIRGFKSARAERVRQRFQSLETEVRKILGWSSQLGGRFLVEVVESFMREKSRNSDPARGIEKCVDPYAILAKPTSITREFRDRACREVAEDFRKRHLEGDRDALALLLRRHLVEWVNASFDEEGDAIWSDGSGERIPPVRSALALRGDERRDLLVMAVETLLLPDSPDWSDPEHVAGLRALLLSIQSNELRGKSPAIVRVASVLRACGIGRIPESLLGIQFLEETAEALRDAGEFEVVHVLRESIAARRAERSGATQSSRDRLAAARALRKLGDAVRDLGRFEEARMPWLRSLEMLRELRGGELESEANLEEIHVRLGHARQYRARGNRSDWSGWTRMALSGVEELLRGRPTPEAAMLVARVALEWCLVREAAPEAAEVCRAALEALSRPLDGTSDGSVRGLPHGLQGPEASRLRALLHLALADAHRKLGADDRAAEELDAAEQAALVLGEPPALPSLACAAAEAAARLADIRLSRGEPGEPDLARAESYLEGLPTDLAGLWRRLAVSALRSVGCAALRAGDPRRAIAYLEDALERLRFEPEPTDEERPLRDSQRFDLLLTVADAHRSIGEFDAVTAVLEEVVDGFRAGGRRTEDCRRMYLHALAGLAADDRPSRGRAERTKAVLEFAGAAIGSLSRFREKESASIGPLLDFAHARLVVAMVEAARARDGVDFERSVVGLSQLSELRGGGDPTAAAILAIDGYAEAMTVIRASGWAELPDAWGDRLAHFVRALHRGRSAFGSVEDGWDRESLASIRTQLSHAASCLEELGKVEAAAEARAVVDALQS